MSREEEVRKHESKMAKYKIKDEKPVLMSENGTKLETKLPGTKPS